MLLIDKQNNVYEQKKRTYDCLTVYSLNGIVTLTNRNPSDNVTWSIRVTLAHILGDQIAAQTETNRNDFRRWIFAF